MCEKMWRNVVNGKSVNDIRSPKSVERPDADNRTNLNLSTHTNLRLRRRPQTVENCAELVFRRSSLTSRPLCEFSVDFTREIKRHILHRRHLRSIRSGGGTALSPAAQPQAWHARTVRPRRVPATLSPRCQQHQLRTGACSVHLYLGTLADPPLTARITPLNRVTRRGRTRDFE